MRLLLLLFFFALCLSPSASLRAGAALSLTPCAGAQAGAIRRLRRALLSCLRRA